VLGFGWVFLGERGAYELIGLIEVFVVLLERLGLLLNGNSQILGFFPRCVNCGKSFWCGSMSSRAILLECNISMQIHVIFV
jgi:hypothetical protein